jgi:2-amino-4-hydroxy-6-hydroxymethyldihydropteridine diphosphokinase
MMPLAYIALGANLPSRAGPPEATLVAAAARLASLGCITACSSLYSTAPVGLPPGVIDQPRFLNAVVALQTSLAPDRLLHALHAIEREFGRDRSAGIPNGPRTLDLDILLIGDLIVSEFDLQVPHPRFAERAFVLIPLNEIAPQLRDPRSGAPVSQLLQSLFPQPETAMDAAIKIQSDRWRAGVCPGSGAPDPVRPNSRE